MHQKGNLAKVKQNLNYFLLTKTYLNILFRDVRVKIKNHRTWPGHKGMKWSIYQIRCLAAIFVNCAGNFWMNFIGIRFYRNFTGNFTEIRNIQLKKLRHSGYTTYINTTRTGDNPPLTGSCCVNICRIPTVPLTLQLYISNSGKNSGKI